MNSIVTARLLSGQHEALGRSWFYDFREVPQFCVSTNVKKHIESLSARYAGITKHWDIDRNSEWICRIYLSAKMIMFATLQLQALEYARQQNLRVVAPYLEYYSILSVIRSVVYTLPEVEWMNGDLVKIPHRKAINLVFDHLAFFNKPKAAEMKGLTFDLKSNREIISYRSPSSGDKGLLEVIDVVSFATLLAEFTQLNSELLERSIHKNADESSFVFREDYAEKLTSVTIDDRNFFDKEDYYRVGYLMRKYPLPPNVLHIMTEGHVEDFFGAWSSENGDGFDPDANWRLIFDIP